MKATTGLIMQKLRVVPITNVPLKINSYKFFPVAQWQRPCIVKNLVELSSKLQNVNKFKISVGQISMSLMWVKKSVSITVPAGIYLLKVNNRNT